LKIDERKNGKISLLQLREVLLASKMINLTPFQIFVLIGSANPDKDGFVNYKSFAGKIKDMIDGVFSLENLSKVAN